MATVAHLFKAPIYVYDTATIGQNNYFPWEVDCSLSANVNTLSMYLYFTGDHLNVVCGVL